MHVGEDGQEADSRILDEQVLPAARDEHVVDLPASGHQVDVEATGDAA